MKGHPVKHTDRKLEITAGVLTIGLAARGTVTLKRKIASKLADKREEEIRAVEAKTWHKAFQAGWNSAVGKIPTYSDNRDFFPKPYKD